MEQWRDVPGFEGRYQVSDEGRVRSVDRRVRLVVHGLETTRLARGRVLRPARGTHGYLTVVLGRDGGTKHVHQLVALAFIGPRPPRADVAHNDGSRTNNHAGNLRYASRAENNEDKVRHGKTLLSEAEVAAVRELVPKLGFGGQAALARELGVSQCHLSAVVRRRLHRSVP